MEKKSNIWIMFPIMLTFFVMGFVDLVGIASNYVKEDFELSDTIANMLPSMVFFWFLICAVPTGMLMNKIGRKKTVLISLVVTIVSLLLPIISYSYVMMLLSFSLLGIGNALMQVSLNPLLSNVVKSEKLASSLTMGQFVKAIASFSAPYIAAWGALQFDDWKILFPIFMIITVLAIIWLGLSSINEQEEEGRSSTFGECFALLGDKIILLAFFGIMCHVGIDVGFNVTAPKILIERLGLPLSEAGEATSLYFLFRTIGCLTGTFVLAKFSSKNFFFISVILMVVGFGGLFFFHDLMLINVCIACIGLGNSNVFPIILSQAMLHLPDRKNEVSGLMIMGLIGGAIFPPIMGVLSDSMGSQTGAIIVLSIGVVYLLFLAPKLKR